MHAQSDGQVEQSSPHSGWHVPLPQSGVHTHVVGLQVLHVAQAQSAAQLQQVSHEGSQTPFPQDG